ncbi:MAG: hypothetical protein QM784_06245 [Polyangiaceae bacterium]
MIDSIQSSFSMLTSKGAARIVATDGQNVTLHAAFPSPPGSPLSGTLDSTSHALRVKVHGCRAVVDPAFAPRCFEITGRWVNLSRDAREALLGSKVSAPSA